MLHPTFHRKDSRMPSRAKIAPAATLVALGALAAVALASGSGGDPAAVQTQDDVATPEVRTEVVRRTVHRRAKAASSPSGSGSASSGRGPAPAPATAAPAPAPAAVAQASATPDDHGGRHDDDRFDDHGGDRDDDFGDDRSGHGRDDDDDSGHGRGRGRGGDDD
jgi:hypothetical protein